MTHLKIWALDMFTQPRYSIQEVNAAGRKVAAATTDVAANWDGNEWTDYFLAVHVVNNWRAAHAYPLHTFAVNLRELTNRLTIDPLIAQRIKRLPSIALKLNLQPSMKLSQMQDLGGCRAILGDVASVRDIVAYYETKSRIKHKRQNPDNYIDSPKPSGYRGVHLIYRYFSDKKKKAIYNGLKIEMQIRSRYQHAWATAVETVGMFSGQALKSSLGSEDWKRFFALMGSVIALREKTPTIPGTPTKRGALLDELRGYANELRVEDRLVEYSHALHAMSSASSDSSFFLLQLDPERGSLQVTGYSYDEAQLAEQRYAEAEETIKKAGGKGDAVLVSVESITALRRAYPNYFADTRLFAELMTQALSGRSRSIRVSDIGVAQGTLLPKQPELPFEVIKP